MNFKDKIKLFMTDENLIIEELALEKVNSFKASLKPCEEWDEDTILRLSIIVAQHEQLYEQLYEQLKMVKVFKLEKTYRKLVDSEVHPIVKK